MISADSKILFDKFEIIDYLKKDDYSSVYLASHVYLSKKIVLKVLDKSGIKDESIIERFKREAKLLAGLDHKNIIKVLDFGIYGDFFYISFEYFESNNLRYFLNHASLNEEQKTDLLKQLFISLHFAHQNNIIHRDIKPENIFVNEKLHLKMGDFGLAYTAGDSFVTNKTAVVGTPAYMSPEQLLGETPTEKSDLFSAGVVAYELFTGENLFIADDINQTINNILNFDYDSALSALNNIPKEIAFIISKLINSDPKDRFNSAKEALEHLNVNQDEIGEISETPTTKIRPTKVIRISIVLISSLLLIIISVFAWRNLISGTDESIAGTSLSDQQKIIENKSNTQSPSGEQSIPDEKSVINTEVAPDNPLKNVDQQKKNENNTLKAEEISQGTLKINVLPWAYVYINSKLLDSTPLKDDIRLKKGNHKITLKNPGYPDYETDIKIQAGKEKLVSFNLDALFSFLSVKVHPWGKIFIDDEEIGDTPFYKPIVLNAGIYTISIVNPEFGKFEEKVTFVKGDTLEMNYNFFDQKILLN